MNTAGIGATLRTQSGIYWGLLLGSAPAMVLAILIHRHTHHRPLGAVTFTLLTSAILVFSVLVAQRCKRYGGSAWAGCRVAAVLSLLLPVLAIVVLR